MDFEIQVLILLGPFFECKLFVCSILALPLALSSGCKWLSWGGGVGVGVGVGLRSILVTNKRINLCCIVVLRESYTYFLVNKPYYFFAMILAFREKKKREERAETQKANEAVTKCLGVYQNAGQ